MLHQIFIDRIIDISFLILLYHFLNWHTKPAQTPKRGILREWSNTPLIVGGTVQQLTLYP
jgi:hypothetical protein